MEEKSFFKSVDYNNTFPGKLGTAKKRFGADLSVVTGKQAQILVKDSEKFNKMLIDWNKQVEDMGHVTGEFSETEFNDYSRSAERTPLKEGKFNETKTGKPISYFSMITLLNNLSKINFEERILEYNLNPDRADVILPALKIFLNKGDTVSAIALLNAYIELNQPALEKSKEVSIIK